MKTLLLITWALLLACTLQGSEAQKEPSNWPVFSNTVKGVCVAKVKKDKAESFVFFPGTNHVRATSTLSSEGVSVSSLDEAIAFLKRKPSGILFSLASPGALRDDAKILLKMSDGEVNALTEAAREPQKKEPNQAPEPTAPSGRGSS